jgi:hypothetical protein
MVSWCRVVELKALVTVIILTLSVRVGSSAQESPFLLRPGKTVEGSLSAGKAQNYTVPLNAGDYLSARVETTGAASMISVYTPDGKRYREFRGRVASETSIYFVAESGAGPYRLEVKNPQKPSDKDVPAGYRITSVELISSAERLKRLPAPEQLHSARIQALRKAIEAKASNPLPEFWEEVRREGTPLIEHRRGQDAHAGYISLASNIRDKDGVGRCISSNTKFHDKPSNGPSGRYRCVA